MKGKKKFNKKDFKPRGFKANDKTTEEVGSSDVVESKKKGDNKYNDPIWYGSGQPLVDAANLAYSNPLGDKIQISTYLNNGATKLTQNVVLPGIMAFGIQPLLYANNGLDPLATIQTVSQKIYSFIRHANSGSKNYERSDLMMYIAAVADVYSLIAWATLAYGLCFTYEQKNKYYGKALVDALGFDYDDIVGNLSDFRGYINSLIQIVNTFYIPKGMPYIDRKVNLYSHIIKDADDPKGCVYLFRPESFLQWDGTSYKTGTALKWRNSWDDGDGSYEDESSLFNMKLNFESFKDLASGLVTAISNDEDAGIISGDILKAYRDAGGVRSISLLPTEFRVEPTYSVEALEMINNLTMVGIPVKGTKGESQLDPSDQTFTNVINVKNYGVYQYNNEIMSDPFFNVTPQSGVSGDLFSKAPSAYYGPIFSIHEETKPELNMVVSRLKANVFYTNQSMPGATFYHYYSINEAGSEVCTRMRIYTADSSVSSAALNTSGVCSGNTADNLKLLANIETFDWHPIIYNKVAATGSADVQAIHYEFDNYTVEHPNTLKKMNRTALLAMFGVLTQ